MTGYELAKTFDSSIGFFWKADHQQIYRELSKLRDRGYIQGREVVQSGKPNKLIYTLTPEGRTALRHWAARPSTPPSIKDDLLVRLHGEMERPARLRRPRERQHHPTFEAARDLGDAVEPGSVAADIDGMRVLAARLHHEADDVARQRLDAGRTVTRRCRGDREPVAVIVLQMRGGPGREALDMSMMVSSGVKLDSSTASGRIKSVRMNSECQASSVKTRVLIR